MIDRLNCVPTKFICWIPKVPHNVPIPGDQFFKQVIKLQLVY